MILENLIEEVNGMTDEQKAEVVEEIENQRSNTDFSSALLQRSVDFCRDEDVCAALDVVDYTEPMDYRKVFVYAYLSMPG